MFSFLVILPLVASFAHGFPEPTRTYSTNSRLFQRGSSTVVKRAGGLTGSSPAVWNNGVELFTPVDIAGSNFSMVLDTGSADFWVFCTEETNAAWAKGRTVYNPSTGKKMDGAQFKITYGLGEADGDIYVDKVTMAGITVQQAIGCAKNVDTGDATDVNGTGTGGRTMQHLDGLIGLAFNSGSKNAHNGQNEPPQATKSALNSVTTLGGGIPLAAPQNTFAENAFSQLESGFWTVDIKNSADGVWNWGFIDEERFSTPITYMPVRNWNQWVITASGYSVGKNATTKTGNKNVLIDTGTTNIVVDQTTAEDYYANVPGSSAGSSTGTWSVPCTYDPAVHPDFTVIFTPPSLDASAGLKATFPAGKGGVSRNAYSAVVPGQYLIGGLDGKNDGKCAGGISAQSKGNGWDYILGDVFLESQLVVFDLGQSVNGVADPGLPTRGQIGLGAKPEGPITSGSSSS